MRTVSLTSVFPGWSYTLHRLPQIVYRSHFPVQLWRKHSKKKIHLNPRHSSEPLWPINGSVPGHFHILWISEKTHNCCQGNPAPIYSALARDSYLGVHPGAWKTGNSRSPFCYGSSAHSPQEHTNSIVSGKKISLSENIPVFSHSLSGFFSPPNSSKFLLTCYIATSLE